jgi:hypothetical protein
VNELACVAAEMEDPQTRARLAAELLALRRLQSNCRKYRRRLPGPLQSLVDAPVRLAEEPPIEGDHGLFTQRG